MITLNDWPHSYSTASKGFWAQTLGVGDFYYEVSSLFPTGVYELIVAIVSLVGGTDYRDLLSYT